MKRTEGERSAPGRTALALVLLSAAAGAAGCNNRYAALTAPPPGLEASLDDEDKAIRLSKGVSLGFECFDGGDGCAGGAATSDPAVARILVADLDTLRADYLHGPQNRSVFVVVGIGEGRTEVRAGGGNLTVTVVPAPR